MNHYQQGSRVDRREEPPYSRVFIVCGKDMRKEDLQEPFEKYGEIDDIYIPRDRTGDSRGVAYIKYSKTSSAAAAIQELHLKTIKSGSKPIKVMIAVNKNDNRDSGNQEKCDRLFIKVSRQTSEDEIKQHFSQFGTVEAVHILKDKANDASKGLAYVNFNSFLHAAKAVEGCDLKYKAVFAAPKQELKRGRDSSDYYNDSFRYDNQPTDDVRMHRDSIGSLINSTPQNYNTVLVTCDPMVPQKHIERLFNIIPGMRQFQYSSDTYNRVCKAFVTYEDEKAAAYAVERLNNFEFPSGETVYVNPGNPLTKVANDLTNIVNSFKYAVDAGAGTPDLVQLADAIAQASSLIKTATTGRAEPKSNAQDMNYCDVRLPPLQPMAAVGSKVAQRCFIVCKPHPPPLNVLKDVFRRFGDLIDISTFPNKSFGYAKYASVRAAQEAIGTLHGAVVCGAILKVLEADERPPRDDHMNVDIDPSDRDSDADAKRVRLLDNQTDH